jgi:hypothetical protein
VLLGKITFTSLMTLFGLFVLSFGIDILEFIKFKETDFEILDSRC